MHHLTIQLVPGHAGIEGNELADQHAKQAANSKKIRAALPWAVLNR